MKRDRGRNHKWVIIGQFLNRQGKVTCQYQCSECSAVTDDNGRHCAFALPRCLSVEPSGKQSIWQLIDGPYTAQSDEWMARVKKLNAPRRRVQQAEGL